ncbi:hypothetical protein [Symmachiella dynata]|uniref:hypothetical protein n=1 Tax=Symmachiella dynata TaxID=2527995 RepID=UPI00119EA2E9|nr:hypothetical protein [Symmachiella dynata]
MKTVISFSNIVSDSSPRNDYAKLRRSLCCQGAGRQGVPEIGGTHITKNTNGGEHQQRANGSSARSTQIPASVNFIINIPQREAQIAMAARLPSIMRR